MNTCKSLVMFLGSLLLSGCYSFYQIDLVELQELKGNNSVKIKLETGNNLLLKNVSSTSISDDQKLEIVQKDSMITQLALKEIKNASVEKFDYPKTILTPLFICFGIVGVYALFGGTLSPNG